MASIVIDLTPEELMVSAQKIESKISEFSKCYTDIYTAVNDLSVSYKGVASTTFNNRIEGYRNDFEAAQKALQNYVQFLRDYASNMSGTEDDLTAKANALSVGQ